MALLGSLFGSALRSGLKIAEDRLEAGPDAPAVEADLNINGSALAALAGGVMGLLFGTRTAFWTGVALGAAGIDRFDMRLLRLAGVDVDAMIQRARSMADQARQGASAGSGTSRSAEVAEAAAASEAAGAPEFTVESPTSEPA
jgi:hypothetical protein